MAQKGENTLGRLNEVLFAKLERLEGPFERDGFGWMDDLARLLGCGEDCECAE